MISSFQIIFAELTLTIPEPCLDTVVVYNGPSDHSAVLMDSCDASRDIMIMSSDTEMFVTFNSNDNDIVGPGFHMSIQAVDPNNGMFGQ